MSLDWKHLFCRFSDILLSMSHELYKFARDNPNFLNLLERSLSRMRGRYRKKSDEEFKKILNEGFLFAATIVYWAVDPYKDQIPRRTFAKLKAFSSNWAELYNTHSGKQVQDSQQADIWRLQRLEIASILLESIGIPTEIAMRATQFRSRFFLQRAEVAAIDRKFHALISAELSALPERLAPALFAAAAKGGAATVASELNRSLRETLESLGDRLRSGAVGYGDNERSVGRALAAALSGPPSRRRRSLKPPPEKS